MLIRAVRWRGRASRKHSPHSAMTSQPDAPGVAARRGWRCWKGHFADLPNGKASMNSRYTRSVTIPIGWSSHSRAVEQMMGWWPASSCSPGVATTSRGCGSPRPVSARPSGTPATSGAFPRRGRCPGSPGRRRAAGAGAGPLWSPRPGRRPRTEPRGAHGRWPRPSTGAAAARSGSGCGGVATA